MVPFRLIRAALREPLVHFVAAGAVLFGIHGLIARDEAPAADAARNVVSVSAADVEWLRGGFTRQWHRPPSAEELHMLAADLLREKLLAREAQSLGLADDDTVVRRRLAQKMLFVVEDTVRLGDPSDDELRRFHADNAGLFASWPRVSFEQIYFSPERRRDPAADARVALPALAGGAVGPAQSGDRLMVDAAFVDADETAVANVLGNAFAREVFALPPGAWHGPVASAYGFHLVRVGRIEPGRPRDFAEMKDHVLERWREHKQREAMDRYLAGLAAKHETAVDASVAPLSGSAPSTLLRPVSGGAGTDAR